MAGVVGAAGLLVPLEFGDRFVDTAGVAADDTVDKGGRVVEIVSGGQQVRVLPDGVAGVHADGPG